jgi:hypothetical protein
MPVLKIKVGGSRESGMEHLMIQDVRNNGLWHARIIEHPTNGDRVMRRVEVTQDAPALSKAPTEVYRAQPPLKIFPVHLVEEVYQIVMLSLRL